MANWNKSNVVITKLGSKIISYAAAGVANLDLTRVVVRDTVSTVSQNYNYTLADITDIKQTGRLLSQAGGVGETENTTLVTVRFSNSELESDSTTFNIRQIVLFARLKDINQDMINQYDPNFSDPGEVPFLVAQSSGQDDYDLMPPLSSNPTSFDYDLYVVHTGVPNITVSIQSTGYVHEIDFQRTVTRIESSITEINNTIADLQDDLVGQNTNGANFKDSAWLPVYTESTDSETGLPTVSWSTAESILAESIFDGKKSAERFNQYVNTDETHPDRFGNIAVADFSHVEGSNNLTTAPDSHIEGTQNYVGYSLSDTTGDTNHNANAGTHVEGNKNTAVDGWSQHIEGAMNYSEGYCSHIEGYKNTNRDGGINHIEGFTNKITSGTYSHVSGMYNVISGSQATNVIGYKNEVVNSNEAFVGGVENSVTASMYSFVFGSNNNISNSDSTYVIGKSNTANQANNYSIISGASNTIYNSTHSFIFGNGNLVDHVYNSQVFGQSNRVNTGVTRSSIGGNSNTLSKEMLTESNDSYVSGYSNTLIDVQSSVMCGKYNEVQYALGSAVLGQHNTVPLDVYEGSKNNSQGIINTFIVGAYNNIKHTESSVIMGASNKVRDYRPHEVPSEWRLSSHNVVAGEQNDAKGIYSTVLSGYKNNVSNIHDSIICGSNNNIDGLDTPASGYTNSVLCMALRSTVQNHTEPQVVFGSDNEVSGNNSLTSGVGLISSNNNSVTFGKFNVADNSNTYAFIIGGGTNNSNRSNLATIDWTGKLDIKDISVGTITSLVAKITELEEAIQRLTPSGT